MPYFFILSRSWPRLDLHRLARSGNQLGSRSQEAIIAAAWKSYALGYEVFCEASYEGDTGRPERRRRNLGESPRQLQAIGQYDA